MKLNFKNRITFYFLTATALIILAVYIFIYQSVNNSVFKHIDSDLTFEASKHFTEIKYINHQLHFLDSNELQEKEHREIQVNPVFLQLVSTTGKILAKSPNLKKENLKIVHNNSNHIFNTQLNGEAIRQIQLPIVIHKQTKGLIVVAMSIESSLKVLDKLLSILWASYLFVLIGLYFIGRFIADKSIQPIRLMTSTITGIEKNKLNTRVQPPIHKDEIYRLTKSFNKMLDRLQNTLDREKQFTSDASHELRTPLTTIKGTLEILVRKPRTQQEYEEKINYCLLEIDQMATMIDQLLLIARLEYQKENEQLTYQKTSQIVTESIQKHQFHLQQKKNKP